MQVKRAPVNWVKDNIARYDGNSKQLFLLGHSAGSYIAVSYVSL
jgi:carboxylesterase type B